MDHQESRSDDGSISDLQQFGARRLVQSYPSQQRTGRGRDLDLEVKLAELIGEDKNDAHRDNASRCSRRSAPVQLSGQDTFRPPSTQEVTSTVMTPSLPPLHNNIAQFGASSDSPKASEESSDSPEGLTALPKRPILTFGERVFHAGKSDLLYDYLVRYRLPWRFKTERHGAIDITTLQNMRKYVLQQKLVAQVTALGRKGAWLEIGIGETIREYCQLQQDLDYMRHHAMRGDEDDPFRITTERPLELQLLEECGLAPYFPSEGSPEIIPEKLRRLERSSPSLRLVLRLTIMLGIAAVLILPFLVVLLTDGYLSRILVACGCVLAFAVLMAYISRRHTRLLPAMALVLIYAATVVILSSYNPLRYAA